MKALLMGGQACVLYGAAEFSRDTDLAVMADADNLHRLQNALDDLDAARIAVPPFEQQYLERGHMVHFRCGLPDLQRLRIDVMAVMRGLDPFPDLWGRRTSIEMGSGESLDLLSLPDLVRSKKTQRDKDWPMIRRLVEVNYLTYRDSPTPERLEFWMAELRTPELLRDLAQRFPAEFEQMKYERPALTLTADLEPFWEVTDALRLEEWDERAADQQYWAPLKRELEELRRAEARQRRAAQSATSD